MYIKVCDNVLALARSPTELCYGEILLLSLIISFDKCYMTNKTFAELLYSSERSIKRWLMNLKRNDLIEVYYDNVKGVERRVVVPKLAPN